MSLAYLRGNQTGSLHNYLSRPTKSLYITRGDSACIVKLSKEVFLKKVELKLVYCIVAFGSNKSTYMYSDWLNNFWIVQSHLPVSPHSSMSVNNKPIQKDDVPICLHAYNTGWDRGRGTGGFQQLGPWAFIQRAIIIIRHGLYTVEQGWGESLEREILFGEIYSSWGTVGTHREEKCHKILDIFMRQFIDLLFEY
jgi:hypothetical protein